MIRESVHCFGPGDRLTGIAVRPQDRQHNTCVLFLNSGLLHRVGPYRMFVDLAREIATMGMPCFRLDLSGLGDSLPRDDARSERERVLADIGDAFDFLQREFDYRRFIIIGLCSGADNAHWAGLAEQRMVGAVMLDGPGYPNFKFYVARCATLLLSASAWRNMLSVLKTSVLKTAVLSVNSNAARGLHAGTSPRQQVFVRPFPPREQADREIRAMVERGMKLLYLYTGGVERYFNHHSQFGDNFPSVVFNRPGANVQYEFNPQFDHTYSDLQHRRYLFTRVRDWLAEQFMA